MWLKRDPIAVRHALRAHELDLVFGRCPPDVFERGLELGAGDGYQSRLLLRWIQSLTSTDFSGEALPKDQTGRIDYRICDAETVAQMFRPGEFDVVFSSNLLEHLPCPESALRGIHAVLAPDGITVHAVPNSFWKLMTLLLYPLHRVDYALRRKSLTDRLRDAVRGRSHPHGLSARPVDDGLPDNNPKSTRADRSMFFSLFVAPVHGVSRSHVDEFRAFGKRRWRQEFEGAGFELVAVLKGPVSSGYRFGFNRIRRVLERIGFGSEFVYVAVKRGARSPYAAYFRK